MTFTHELFQEDGKYYCFCGNPIAITAKMAYNQFATDATYTQVVIVVDINGTKHEFPSDIANGESVTIDVSSAWLAEYAKVSNTLDDIKDGSDVLIGSITAYTKFLPKNTLYVEKSSSVNVVENVYALQGAVSEYVIIKENLTQLSAVNKYRNKLSTKPDGEVVGLGQYILTSKFTKGTTLVTTTHTKTTETGAVAGTTVWVEDDIMRKEFWFVNRFGVLENASALTLESVSVKHTSKSMKIIGKPSFTPNARVVKKRTELPCSIKMSSGFVTRDWAMWWADEFVGSKEVWLRQSDGTMIPVSVECDEEIAIYDNAKGELVSVDFVVTPIVGGILNL